MRFASVAATLVVLLTVGACGGDEGASDERTIRGVIVEIDARSLDDIRSFVLLNRGQQFEITVNDETHFAFPPGHLNEHRTTAEPVEIEAIRRDGELVAVTVDDATH